MFVRRKSTYRHSKLIYCEIRKKSLHLNYYIKAKVVRVAIFQVKAVDIITGAEQSHVILLRPIKDPRPLIQDESVFVVCQKSFLRLGYNQIFESI